MSRTATAVVVVEQDAQLQMLDAVHEKLAAITTVEEAKAVRDEAEALRVYAARSKKGLAAQNRCAYVRLCAERRGGQLLREMLARGEREGRGGDRRSNSADTRLKLDDLGINYDQSSRWQRLANLPDGALELMLQRMEEFEEELTFQRVARDPEYRVVMHAGDPYHPWWGDGLPSTAVTRAYEQLARRVNYFLVPETKEEQQLRMVLHDQTYLEEYSVERLLEEFEDLHTRVKQAIDGLRRRKTVRIPLFRGPPLETFLPADEAAGRVAASGAIAARRRERKARA